MPAGLMSTAEIPPRNGEGDQVKLGGGVDVVRSHHRTVGAAEENVRFARNLRKNMSLPEVLLWQQLRQRPGGFRFRRQYPVNGYVLDFACLSRRLAIEIDGEGHDRGNHPQRDEARDATLALSDIETLRIPARDVLRNLEGVLQLIVSCCEVRPLHRSTSSSGPPPRSGEEFR